MTMRSCNNCGKVNCENFQRQRIDCCGLWVSYKDYITELENKIADIKANCDLAIEGRDIKIKELEKENAILEKALNLYVNWADECGIAWDNFPDMTDKWYKKVEEKNLGWIAGLTFMVKEEAKEQLVKECENGK